MTTRYRLLDWDSEHFGVKVAEVTVPEMPVSELRELLADLRGWGVELVYWPARPGGEEGRAAVRALGGALVDEKTTFLARLDPTAEEKEQLVPVVSYRRGTSPAVMESLAIASGEYSRFAMDTRIPRQKFVELYRLWMRGSIAGELADEVLVIEDDDGVAGMITLRHKGDRGDIGLIAVDARCRGKRYGEALVRAAKRRFARAGYEHCQVVTQGSNVPACNLYLKCGFRVETKVDYYHFWL